MRRVTAEFTEGRMLSAHPYPAAHHRDWCYLAVHLWDAAQGLIDGFLVQVEILHLSV